MSKQGKWIEVQIRSDRMDDIAEQGFAAHWKYKDANAAYDENELDKWLNSIKEILDDPQPDTLDFLDTIKLNLFASEILVFTPKGEIKTMPSNSTVLDFAFSIHSFLGTHCIGAKVNHKLAPIGYRLKSGDQVEILTSRTQRVQPDWIDFANTAKAKGKIQAILRRENREKQRLGEETLRAFLESRNMEYTSAVAEKLCKLHAAASREALMQSIGSGKISLGEEDINFLNGKKAQKGWRKFIPFVGKKETPKVEAVDSAEFVKNINRKATFIINEESLSRCTLPSCCSPIPGDDVMGYITPQHTLEIHKRSCPTATKHKTRYGNGIIAAQWQCNRTTSFPATISIKGADDRGVLYAIADVLHKQFMLPVTRIELNAKEGVFEGSIDIRVYDTSDIQQICEQLSKIRGDFKAFRKN